jgi:hypothetical protein
MTNIEITGTELVVHVEGFDRFFALRSELRVPLAHVAGAEPASAEARSWFHGFRAAGTNIPGVITAGTFFERDGHVFWDVHDADAAIAIRLHDDRFVRLVVEVADSEAAIAAVNAAVAAPTGPVQS